MHAAVLWAPFEVGTFCRDSRRLRLAAEFATDRTTALLEAAESHYQQQLGR